MNTRKRLLMAAVCALPLAIVVSVTHSSGEVATGLSPSGMAQIAHSTSSGLVLGAAATSTRAGTGRGPVREVEEKWVLAAFGTYAERLNHGQVGEFTRASALSDWDTDSLAVLHLDGGNLDRLDPTRMLRYELFSYLRDAARATQEDLLPSLLHELGHAKDDETWGL